MTFKIWYKEHQLFDIELYIKGIDEHSDKCYTEIKPCLIEEGIAYYVFENIKDEAQLKEFIAYTEEIHDLRLTLFEGYPEMTEGWSNEPISTHQADRRMCKIHKPKFVEMMKEYCKRYNFGLSED